MRTKQERAILTGQALIRHLGWPPPKARQELGRLEGDLARAFEGQVLTGALKASVLEMAQARIPAPEGYRWRVEAAREGEQTVLFTWLDGSARDPGIPEGYRWAARVITGYDGGNHEALGDLWACERCGQVIVPGLQDKHDEHHSVIDGLAAEHSRVTARDTIVQGWADDGLPSLKGLANDFPGPGLYQL